MAVNDIKLGVSGSEALLSAFGRKFSESMEEISREDRTSSGKLVRDIITTKKMFSLKYDMIHDDDLSDFADLYGLQSELSVKITRPDTTEDTYTVLLRPFDKERVVSLGCKYWGGVNIKLAEV